MITKVIMVATIWFVFSNILGAGRAMAQEPHHEAHHDPHWAYDDRTIGVN